MTGMIKAAGVVRDAAGDRPALIMGLMPENIDRLVAGDPIVFEAPEVGLAPLRVVILAAGSPEELREYLGPITTADTTETTSPRTDHFVDWRAVATELIEAIEALPVTFTSAAGPPGNRLAQARARYRAAREREGL
jgi:hypothetical protein